MVNKRSPEGIRVCKLVLKRYKSRNIVHTCFFSFFQIMKRVPKHSETSFWMHRVLTWIYFIKSYLKIKKSGIYNPLNINIAIRTGLPAFWTNKSLDSVLFLYSSSVFHFKTVNVLNKYHFATYTNQLDENFPFVVIKWINHTI